MRNAEKMMKWQNFVMFHSVLKDDYYSCDPSFDHSKYTFIKANPKVKPHYNTKFGYRVINEYDLKFYDDSLQKRMYMAPSMIYHVYKNRLHEKYDYIGFLEYDLILKSPQTKSVTQCVNSLLSSQPRPFIMPYSLKHSFERLASQDKILLNHNQCISEILKEVASELGLAIDYDKYLKSSDLVPSQQSFLIDVESFEILMKFISKVVEERRCERSGSWHRPSTLLDRYVGICLYFMGITHRFTLTHANLQQWRDNRGWSLFIRDLKQRSKILSANLRSGL